MTVVRTSDDKLNADMSQQEAFNMVQRAGNHPSKERLDAALKTLEQALHEVRHAQDCGAEWYTKGSSGLYQQVRMWVNKGFDAIREARAAPETPDAPSGFIDAATVGAMELVARLLPYAQATQAADYEELTAQGSVCRAAEKALAAYHEANELKASEQRIKGTA